VVRALERHRRSVAVLTHAEPDALVRLVAEHARNAGVSAWLLGFSAHDDPPRLPVSVVVSRHLDDVRLDPDGWLVEDQVTLVQP
jgi:hypothetical protein